MIHPQPLVLALDIGTTSTKAGAYAVDGSLVASASSGYPLLTPHPGYAVQEPDAILAAVIEAAQQVVADVGAAVEQQRAAGRAGDEKVEQDLALRRQQRGEPRLAFTHARHILRDEIVEEGLCLIARDTDDAAVVERRETCVAHGILLWSACTNGCVPHVSG